MGMKLAQSLFVPLRIGAFSKTIVSRTFKRSISTHAEPIDELKRRGPWTYLQDISGSHVGALNATLEGHIPNITTRQHDPLAAKEVPPGYHLIFFNDANAESALASDGYHKAQAPDEIDFPARMWLGGSIEYSNSPEATPLVQSQLGSAIEVINNAEYSEKQGKGRMDVTLDRFMYGGNVFGTSPESCDVNEVLKSVPWTIHERRTLAYLPQSSHASRLAIFDRIVKPRKTPEFRHAITPTPLTLFRYSALTFNSHRIHYDPEYCHEVEMLPGCLVQGPLSVTFMLAWLSNHVIPKLGKFRIKKFTYRNLVPMLSGQAITLNTTGLKTVSNADGTHQLDVWVENANGSMCVSGTVQVTEF